MKLKDILLGLDPKASPSMRREWIEMAGSENMGEKQSVSLHAEGVD